MVNDRWGDNNIVCQHGDFYTCHDKYNPGKVTHDDVIKWKHLPRYWPFVRGIHRSPVNSPHKGPVTRSFGVFFDLHPNKRLSKQWWGWWFETLSCPLWRHCNVLWHRGCGCHFCGYMFVILECRGGGGALLLIRISFNPSIDKPSHAKWSEGRNNHPFPNFNSCNWELDQ